jgi:sodium-dependent dicarboxylate transporter 2/3/5
MVTSSFGDASMACDASVDQTRSIFQKFGQTLRATLLQRRLVGAAFGPLVGGAIWWLPLGLDPVAHRALAIAAFMVVYWITEPIEPGITALLGCVLFWAMQVTTFSSAFQGFTTTSPWFIFGALLMGEAASRTDLAKRVGYLVMHRVGTSYSQLLLGIITLVWLLNFLIPAPTAELAIMAPLVIGVVAAFGLGPHSNVAKGLFIILTYTCSLFSKMNLAASSTILTRGIIETQAGLPVWWSQWFIAHVPAALLTIFASWLIMRWLYPPERHTLPGGQQYLHEALQAMGPWTRAQKTTVAWLLVALILWATDFWHHMHPAVIALGTGLLLTFPQVGVLDAQAVKQVNFLLIIFVSGALGMGHVLTETGALDLVSEPLMRVMIPLLSNVVQAAMVLYWGGVLYHFLLGDHNAMVSTSLPMLLKSAEGQGYNAMLVGMIWSFASGGILFVYQSAVSVLGYSYGYFEGKDLLKVGTVLTLVEGAILLVLVTLYWPQIGLPW